MKLTRIAALALVLLIALTQTASLAAANTPGITPGSIDNPIALEPQAPATLPGVLPGSDDDAQLVVDGVVGPPIAIPELELSKTGSQAALADRTFGFELFKRLYQDGENLVFSPYSLSSAMTMVWNGASGSTKTEIAKALSLSKLKIADISSGSLDLMNMLAGEEMKIANGLFIANTAQIEDAFIKNALGSFKASVQNVDFTKPEAAETINAWVKEATNEMIDKLSDSYDPLTVMSVVNAIAFDAKWQSRFDANATQEAAFHGAAGDSQVQMMSEASSFPYTKTSSYQAIMLPYEGGKYSMLVVLPAEGKNLQTVVNSLMSEKAFSKLISGMEDTHVALSLPRFELASDLPLKSVLQAMGIKRAFNPDQADFSGISKADELFISEVLQKAGRIDILVNCAGISQRISVADMTLADMKRIFEVNVYGLFLCSKAVLPAMRKKQYGRIVNLASVSGKRGGGVFGGAHYAASKAAVLGFSKNLAREVVLDGITVNSVAPGLVNTDIFASMPEDALKKVIGDIPLGRLGNIKEIAATICFLASDEASYITGEEIDINGGSHMD